MYIPRELFKTMTQDEILNFFQSDFKHWQASLPAAHISHVLKEDIYMHSPFSGILKLKLHQDKSNYYYFFLLHKQWVKPLCKMLNDLLQLKFHWSVLGTFLYQ